MNQIKSYLKKNLIIYIIITFLFLLLGLYFSDLKINNDENFTNNRLIGKSKVSFNDSNGFFTIDQLSYNIEKTLNIYETYYHNHDRLIKIERPNKQKIIEKFEEISSNIDTLNKNYINQIRSKYEYNLKIKDMFTENQNEVLDVIRQFTTEDQKDAYIGILNSLLTFNVKYLKEQEKLNLLISEIELSNNKYEFISLNNLIYQEVHNDFVNTSKIVVLMTFVTLGIFLSWIMPNSLIYPSCADSIFQ